MTINKLLCLVLSSLLSLSSICAQEKKEPENKPDSSAAPTPLALAERVDSSLLGSLKFRNIGPAFMSGRIGDLAIDPNSPNTWYVAVGSGGLWKTTNAGTTFTPIFDSQSSYSIGCVTIDPQNSNTIWVGTGENIGGRHVGFGDGIYVSRDGGKSFENRGLKGSEHISKIIVDPRDSQTIYVAVQGPLWSPGGDRGLYKSTDGGATWRCTLSKGPYTGVTDITIDHTNPDVMYAATHQRHRTVWALLNTGSESGIHKSTDGGENWRELTQGIPGDDKGKIALGVSPQKNNVVYATIELVNRKGGFFRSEDFGESWQKMSDFAADGTGPHYYNEIYLDPHRFDVIYHANNILVRSVDGGKNFVPIEGESKHVDNHAVVFHPTDPDFLLVGSDGGIYQSNDFGKTYRFFGNLPLTQFYKIDVDYDLPFYNVVGGTQDNNTQYGPVATRFVQGITNSDWSITVGGDGHDNAIDPTNPDIMYCESQEGYVRRFDRRTGESVDIRPQPAAGENGLRFNWDTPILISPHNPKRVYVGSRMLHRSDDQGDSWTAISPDLSRQKDRWQLPIMGRIWGIDAGFDLLAMTAYSNITSVSESPVTEGLIYVGTDDGLIHVTEDGGKNWSKIERFFDVPEGAFVNDIKADRHDSNIVYACLDHHKTGDLRPFVIKSSDRGKTWESLAKSLPEKHLVWRIEQDHVNPKLLFLGTEFGVFASVNGGEKWFKFSSGLPTIPIRDLAIQKRENDLVCATFGRGIYVLDDYSPLREITSEALDKESYLFSSRRSWWYAPADLLGGKKGFQGDSFYAAENPTYGAVFTVHFKDEFKSKKDKRKEAEGIAKKENKDAKVATIAELDEEDNELKPMRYLQIQTSGNEFVARVDLPAGKGMHRAAWDFRQAPLSGTGPRPLAAPGEYQAVVMQWDGKESRKISDMISFKVEAMLEPSIPIVERQEALNFQKELFDLQTKLNRARKRLAKAEKIVEQSRSAVTQGIADPATLLSEIREVKLEIDRMEKGLFGNPKLSERFIQDVPAPANRLFFAMMGTFGSTHGPTKTHREQLEIAKTEINDWAGRIDGLVDNQVKQLREKVEGLGLRLDIDE